MKISKPLKTAKMCGITYVTKLVSDETRKVLTLMEANPGCYIERLDIFNFGRLIIPDQPPLKIEQGFLISILEYCKPIDNYMPNVTQYELHPEALRTIRIYD